MAIDLDKVKAAAEALGKLNKVEMEFLKAYTQMSSGKRASNDVAVLGGAEPTGRKLGPDPRGRYKCSLCDKILPTKRGRAIHEKRHDRETAPQPKPEVK